MRIAEIKIQNNRPHSMDILEIEDAEGNRYSLTDGEIEQMLIENGQLCEHCLGEGEVTAMERVWPNEPHMAPIGTEKCICRLKTAA